MSEASEATQFQKGETGNPKGRPKGSGLFANFVKNALEELGQEDFMEWIKNSAEGRDKFYTGIAAKTLPKAVEVSGPDGGPVQSTYIIQPVKPKGELDGDQEGKPESNKKESE